jgi:phosphoribosylformylglycinamidine synthase
LSEGGLAAAVAEMALAGGLGAKIDLAQVPNRLQGEQSLDAVLLFAESNTRFLCEVPPESAGGFEDLLAGVPRARIGQVTESKKLEIVSGGRVVLAANVGSLKAAWQAPLDWT